MRAIAPTVPCLLGFLVTVGCAGGGTAPPGSTVASLTIAPASPAISIGARVQLVATARDANGATLANRSVTWATSNAGIVTVSQDGLVAGVAAGPPVTITATSGRASASTTVTVVDVVATGIADPDAFVDRCPTLDPAYALIRQTFEIRADGVLFTGALTCTEPFSTQPNEQLVHELATLQVLRVAYHLSQGTAGKLPWTTKSLWEWLTTNVAGLNIRSTTGQTYCCDIIGGKRYIGQSRGAASDLDFMRRWEGLSAGVSFLAHEARHADPGVYGHVGGCPASPGTPNGSCDPSYDLANLGAYGIQYWLQSSWSTGYLNVGIGCVAGERAAELASWHASVANPVRSHFVTNTPPLMRPAAPFGGPCLSR